MLRQRLHSITTLMLGVSIIGVRALNALSKSATRSRDKGYSEKRIIKESWFNEVKCMMPIQIQWRFNYLHETDAIEFSVNVGNQCFTIVLPYDMFIVLMWDVVNKAQPFFKQIALHRISGIKQDLKVEFDEAKWDKMMENKG